MPGVCDILDYWFRDVRSDPRQLPERMAFWFGGSKSSDARDREIRKRFEPTLREAAAGLLEEWSLAPDGRSALIILFDQFPRNIYRGTVEAFAYDSRARQLCVEGLAVGADKALPPLQRVFFYLPLEHSESLADQEQCVELMQGLQAHAPEGLADAFASFTDYAIDHRKIIERFGRFPHRNRILRRENTIDEAAFLAEHPGGFGQG
jgi:uncharacterized protein (DUF924 family)